MRKHHSWWVALLGAGALTACGTAVPAAAADDREPAWPKVERGESDYSLDGFTVGPLPEGLERHAVKAASSSDREGNRRSEITWVQGSDDRAGHVAVLRSDRLQNLEDLRQERFGHLRTDGLERLGEDEGFGEDAYVSEDTGHLFWVERPGVGVATHLDPEQWDREDLVELAGSVTDIEDGDSAESAEDGEAAEETGSSDAAEADEADAEDADTEGSEDAAEETAGEGAEAEDAEDAAEEGAEAEDAAATDADATEAPTVEDDAVVAEDVVADEEDSPAEAQEAAEDSPAEEETPVEDQDEAAEAEAAGTEDSDAAEGDADADSDAAEEAGAEDTAPADTDADADAAQDGDPVRASEDEQDDRPATGTEGSASGDAAEDEAAEQPGAESGDAAEGVAFPESSGAEGVPAFHQCAVDRFEQSTGLNADDEGVTEETRAFVERTLDTDALTDGERDRFLATAWFHGSEADKLSAAEECAEDEQADDTTASGVVAELDAQARAVFEQARYGDGTVDADAGAEEAAVEPIGAQEWERVQERLPYSLPSDGS